MSKQIIVLSIVLLISITINVAFVFDIFTKKEIIHDESQTTVKEYPLAEVDINKVEGESKSDLIGSFIVELIALKNLANEEGAEKTVKAADVYIMMKKSQFEALEANMPIRVK